MSYQQHSPQKLHNVSSSDNKNAFRFRSALRQLGDMTAITIGVIEIGEFLTGGVTHFTFGMELAAITYMTARAGFYIKEKITSHHSTSPLRQPKSDLPGALGLYRSGPEQEIVEPVSPELGQQAASMGQVVRQFMNSSLLEENRPYGLRPINEKGQTGSQRLR
ncbi:MAG TPA: hypothetical protein VFV38_43215 [Ktedonobacteraceae bacterium]|nr:hypothetical protein [Ktedonobacteraceae bacterium]